MHRERVRPQLTVIIITLLLFLELTMAVPVKGSSVAIIVYDHAFAKQLRWTANGHITPVNQTSSFTQDDQVVYAYAQATFYSANFTWEWYDPNGQLYKNDTFQAQCDTSPCYVSSSLWFGNSAAATKFGLWRMDLLADDFHLYSDYFYITPIMTQENHWDFHIVQSEPPRVHGDLTVRIHPNNQTWNYYVLIMPYADYAANVTAVESSSSHVLSVITNASRVVVDFGGAESAGYSFVISFDLRYPLDSLNGLYGGSYAFSWRDEPWQRSYDLHPIPETFSITLPKGATLLDIVGNNVVTLDYHVRPETRLSVNFTTTVINEVFGWTLIYRDFTYRDSHLNTLSPPSGLSSALAQPIPFLPLTVANLNVWAAIMSVFLLTASELVSPIYSRSGSNILIDRRRLRIAALLLVALFMAGTFYSFVISQNSIPR
jgi:hypothetical protein